MSVEITGSAAVFETRRKALVQAQLMALKDAVGQAARLGRTRLNDDVDAALKNKRTFLPWTADLFPRGNQLAYEPSALIRSRAPYITNPQTTGARIGGADGVLIPIPGSPAAEVRRLRGGRQPIEIIKARFGDFYQTIPLGSGRGLLLLWPAVKGARKRKGQLLREGYFPAWKRERIKQVATGYQVMRDNAQLIPMFVWKPQVTLSPRLKTVAIMRQLEAQFPDMVAKELARATAAQERRA